MGYYESEWSYKMGEDWSRVTENLTSAGLDPIRVQDQIDTFIRAACESAYRRGFSQGVAFTLRHREGGASDTMLKEWLKRLQVWRRKEHKGNAEWPPPVK